MVNPSAFLADRVHKLRYIAFGFLLFDIVYGSILVSLFESIRLNILGYYTLSVLYVCAILSAIFGIKDKVVLLFYPMLVFAVSFVGRFLRFGRKFLGSDYRLLHFLYYR